MRLDKYLKVSRLIKRRPVANEACDAGRIQVNGKVAKASLNIKVGDIIEITFGDKVVKVEVLSIEETYKKDEARNCTAFFKGCFGREHFQKRKDRNIIPEPSAYIFVMQAVFIFDIVRKLPSV